MSQTLHSIHTDVLSSSLIFSSALEGNESVNFSLCVWQDIYHESDQDPIELFLEKSSFCISVSELITLKAVKGDICILKDLLGNKCSADRVCEVIKENDLTPEIGFYCVNPAAGLSRVESRVSGETDVESLRVINKDLLDMLDLTVTTPIGIIHTSAYSEE